MAETPKKPDTCKRCKAEVELYFGPHSVEDCIEHLGTENASLKAKLSDLEERFDRVISRHELDDSKYGKGW